MTNAVWNSEELSTVTHRDMMLPSQPYFTKMYNGENYFGDLERLLYSMYPERKWIIETKPGMTYDVMSSHTNTLNFLQFLIRMGKFKRVLELGSYIGVSAMYMADGGAKIHTVEKGEEFYKIAKGNFKANGFTKKHISAYNSDALEYFCGDKYTYDMIFIDCAKESYKELLELAIPRLSKKGIILVDDVFFQGDTLNETPMTEKGLGVRKMLDYAARLEKWDRVILPIGNGILMMRKM